MQIMGKIIVAASGMMLAGTAVVSPAGLVGQGVPAAAPDTEDGPDIIVSGVREIVVNGRATRCTPRAGDPADKIDTSPGFVGRQLMEVIPDSAGKPVARPNDEAVTGPDYWQRIGIEMDQYRFRAPINGKPMCIGGGSPDGGTLGQFRRIVDAMPYRGKRVRFTLWASSGGARSVHFFLAAGQKQSKLFNGGNSNNQPWGGNHGWTPVWLEIGPIAEGADHISYGFNLSGPGSVWVYKPKLEIVTDDQSEGRTGDFAIIGGDKH